MTRFIWSVAWCALWGLALTAISCEPTDDTEVLDSNETQDVAQVEPIEPIEPVVPYYLQEPTRTPPEQRPVMTAEEKFAAIVGGTEAPVNTDEEIVPLPEQALVAIAQADEFIEAGDFEMARQRLERADGFAPEHIEIHRRQGYVFYRMGNHGLAVGHFRQVLRKRADDLELQLAMGDVCAAQGSHSQALKYTRQSLLTSESDPANPAAGVAMNRLAQMFERRKDTLEALYTYELLAAWMAEHAESYQTDTRMAELLASPERLNVHRARLLTELGYTDEALALLTDAHTAMPDDAECQTLYLRALGQAGHYERGQAAIEASAGEPIPVDAVEQILRGLARQTCREGTFQESLVFLCSLAGEQPQWSPLIEEIITVYYAPEMSTAQAETFWTYIRDLPAEDPQVQTASYLGGLLARRMGRNAMAEEWFERATQAQPTFLPAQEALFDTWIDRGRGDLALQRANALTETSMDRWMQQYLMGKALLATGDSRRAALALQDAANQGDAYQPVFLLLAEALVERQDIEGAIKAMNRAVAIDPTRPGILDEWMMLYHSAGRLGHFRSQEAPRYVDRYPDNLQVQQMRIKLYLLNNEVAEARELMGKLDDLYPDDLDVRLLNIYANLWLARPRGPAAVEATTDDVGYGEDVGVIVGQWEGDFYYEEPAGPGIVPIDAHMVAPNRLGLQSWIDELPAWALAEAWEELAPLLERYGHERRVRLMAAQVLLAIDRADQAKALWHGLYAITPADLAIVDGYVDSLLACGENPRAIQVLEDARQRSDDDLAVRLKLLGVLEGTQRYDSAVTLLTQWMATLDPQSTTEAGSLNYLRCRLFNCALGAGDYTTAQTALAELHNTSPNTDMYYSLRARWALETGNYAEATNLVYEQLERFLTTDEFLASGQRGMPLAFQLNVGAIDMVLTDARVQLTRWRVSDADLDTGSPVIWLWQMGRHEDVRELMERIARESPSAQETRDWAHWQMLLMLMADNRTDEGVAILDACIADKLEVSRRQYRTFKLVYLLLAERHLAGQQYVAEWIAADPYDVSPRLAMAYLMNHQDRNDEFLTILSEWEDDLGPVDGEIPQSRALRLAIYRIRVSVLYQLGREEEIVTCLEKALALVPDNLEFLLLYASSLDEVGRPLEAIAALERVLADNPRDPTLLNNLAYILAENGIRLREAEVMINKALYDGVNASFLDTKGWVLYKQGRIQPARRVLDNTLAEARKMGTESPLLYDHAGDTYYRDGGLDQARQLWEQALDLAEEIETPSREQRAILETVPLKLEALANGEVPPVAPFGEGVLDELYPESDDEQPAGEEETPAEGDVADVEPDAVSAEE